jgi:DNA topoisomerase-2
MSCSNFVLFDRDYKIKRYSNEREILEEFFEYRYNMYEKRKANMVKRLSQALDKLSN